MQENIKEFFKMLKISNITHMKQPKKYMFLNKIVKVNLLTFNVKFWMKIDRACCSNFHDSVRVNETHSPPHKKRLYMYDIVKDSCSTDAK